MDLETLTHMKSTFRLAAGWMLGLFLAGYFFDLLMYRGFHDPILRIHALFIPDRTIAYVCSNGVSLRIVTRTEVQDGNLLELDKPSRLIELYDIHIARAGREMTHGDPRLIRDSKGLAAHPLLLVTRYPTGAPVDAVFFLSPQAHTDLVNPPGRVPPPLDRQSRPVLYSGITLGPDKASVQDARLVAQCLRERTSELLPFLSQPNGQGPTALGWVARTSAPFPTRFGVPPQTYACGANAVIRTFMDTVSLDGAYVGELTPTGLRLSGDPAHMATVEAFKRLDNAFCSNRDHTLLFTDVIKPPQLELVE